MKKIIVFGGSGFLGSHVADKLSHSGYNVSIFDKVESNFILNNQKMIKGNITNSEEVNNALKGIDYVYNFAGLADIEESKKDPVITVIDSAIPAFRYHKPQPLLVILSSIIIGLSISFLFSYVLILKKEIRSQLN